MYHVIGTGLTAIILYLISYFFYRTGYFSQQFHRKLWNTILAIVFLSTAVAGIFLALQINYKWNIPVIKSVLKWHVESGIGMAFTGIFHFIWHLPYFGNIFKRQDNQPVIREFQNRTSSEISTNLFITGFVSSSVQLLLMREIMNIAGGYELITGTFLGSWLIASAIGASVAGKSIMNDIRKINLIFSVSPIVSLLLMFLLARLFLNSGETPSFLISVIYTFIILIPFCLVSGFTFIKLILIAGSGNNFVPGKSFSIETTGGIVSGIIISLMTSGLMNTYLLLLLIILLSVSYVILSFYIIKNKTKFIAKIFILALASALIFSNPDIFFRQILLPAIKVTDSSDTPYGNITLGKYGNEQSIYYDQRLLSYNADVTEREENIHYAMLQSELPEKVILISGSLASHLQEIAKYPVKKVIYVERDPALTALQESQAGKMKAEIVIENKDAFNYIKNSHEFVDVIILMIPPPSSLLLNRFYTIEFFNNVKKRLNAGGTFMCSPGPGDTYFNKESLVLYSSVYNSLAHAFRYVKPVVGNKLYFIASDKKLSIEFCRLTELRNIKNTYISPDYLSDDLIAKKSDEFSALIDYGIKPNSSLFPVACFGFQTYSISKNLTEKIPLIILLTIVFALPVLAIKRRNLVMYLSASALAGFEIIILLTLQIIIGNMYQLTGLVIAGLMTGLAIGAGREISLFNKFSFRNRIIFLLIFYVGFGLVYKYFITISGGVPAAGLIILSAFIPAVFTGHIFRELTGKTDSSNTSSSIYSSDLAGSALGFMLVSGLAVPVFGIQFSIFLIAALIFAGYLFGTVGNK